LKDAYYLINDDELVAGGFPYRVRVWRRLGQAVVLVEPLPGSPPADMQSAYLAHHIASGILGFSLPETAWYEHSLYEGLDRAFLVRFEKIGGPLRPMFREPAYRAVDWNKLPRALEAITTTEESTQEALAAACFR